MEQLTKNEQLQHDIDQFKQQSQLQQQTLTEQLIEQSRKNEQFQMETEQFKKLTQLFFIVFFLFFAFIYLSHSAALTKQEQLQHDIDQLKQQSQLQQQNLTENLTSQSRKNEELQDKINKLTKNITELTIHIDTLQSDLQNIKIQIYGLDQSVYLLEITMKSVKNHIKFLLSM
jgi:hypothetical protein